MKPVGGAKIPWSASCRILATPTGFITRWTTKNQIFNFYIYILFLDHFCVLIVIIRY